MAYQPTFASPYLTSIDVNINGGNNFKCLINPRDTIEKYRINIYSVLDNSLVCYVRGEVVDGIQKKWYKAGDVGEIPLDISNLIEESKLPLQGSFSDDAWLIVNIPENIGLLNGMDYKWNIELWGKIANVQTEINTIKATTDADPISSIITSSLLNKTEVGTFLKFKNEMREITDVTDKYFVLIDDDGDYAYEPNKNRYMDYFNSTYGTSCTIVDDAVRDFNGIRQKQSGCYIIGVPVSAINKSLDPKQLEYTEGLAYESTEITFATPFTNALEKDKMFTVLDKKITSFDYYFEARSTPMTIVDGETVSFETGFNDIVPDTINSNRIELSIPYLQPENKDIDFYKFELYLGDELVHTTKEVYSSNIEYKYDGLISDNDYKINLIICFSNNETMTVSGSFFVKYDKYNAIINPVAREISDKGCIEIDFSQNSSIEGVLEGVGGDIVYSKYKNSASDVATNKNNAVKLNVYQSIYWNNLNNNPLDLENTTQIIHWHGHPGFHGTIFEKIDETNPSRNIVVGYNGEAFYYKFGNDEVVQKSPFTNYPDWDTAVNATINEDLLYKLNDTDVLEETDSLASNDITYKYWWLIIINDNGVDFIKSKKYTETEV